MIDYTKYQKKNLNKISDYINHYNNIISKKELVYKGIKLKNYINNIDLINEENKKVISKLKSLENKINERQTPKFAFQIIYFIFYILASIAGGAGYFIRKEYFPWIASLFLLCFSVPFLYLIGKEFSYLFLSIDFCSNISNYASYRIAPKENFGLGKYLSCTSKDSLIKISTDNYELGVTFNAVFENMTNNINSLPESIRVGNIIYKRDMNSLKIIKENYKKSSVILENETDITQFFNEIGEQAEILIGLNYILGSLNYLGVCASAKSNINYIEENYCYKNHEYIGYSVLFEFLGIIGVIFLAIGLNKLTLLIKKHYSKLLRGKKEFDDDLDDNNQLDNNIGGSIINNSIISENEIKTIN